MGIILSLLQAAWVTWYLWPTPGEDLVTMWWATSAIYSMLHLPAFWTALPLGSNSTTNIPSINVIHEWKVNVLVAAEAI